MTILVTGATGRIGKHLVDSLLKHGERVRILVKNKNKVKKRRKLEIYEGDLLDKDSLMKAVDGVDTIYHLAAIVDYLAPKDLMYNVNVNGTKNLLDVSKGKKLIYMSSTAVLGKKLAKIPADENTSCRPTNFYGETKLEAEKAALEHGAIVLRATDIYGPGFEEGYFTVISKIKDGTMKIIGNGNNLIQYTYIDDLIQVLLLAKNKGRPGEVYIIAGNEVRMQKELYEMIAEYLGVPPPRKHVSKFLALLYLKLKGKKQKLIPEYIEKLAANRVFKIDKARRELGFNPKVSYKEGIKELVKSYKKSTP